MAPPNFNNHVAMLSEKPIVSDVAPNQRRLSRLKAVFSGLRYAGQRTM